MQNTCFSCSIFINANLYVPSNYCKFAGDFGSNDDSGDFEEIKQDCSRSDQPLQPSIRSIFSGIRPKETVIVVSDFKREIKLKVNCVAL